MSPNEPAPEQTACKSIAILADSFLYDESTGVNGTQVQLFNIANALTGRDFTVHYISGTGDFRHATGTHTGIRLHWMRRATGVFRWPQDILAAMRILDRIDPDIVYQRGRSHLTCAAAAWARKRDRRFVWASNGEDSCDFWKNLIRIRRSPRPLWRKLLLWLYVLPLDMLIHRGIGRATGVINQTQHQKQRLQTNFAKRGMVLPSYFPPPVQDSAHGKESLVLWLANPSPGKRPDAFLDLAERLTDATGWRFVLGGHIPDTPYGRDLAARTAALPNVDTTGAIPFAASDACYDRASLFINTSLPDADGLPNAYIQAWYAGAPVLSLHHDPNGWIARNGLGFCAGGDEAALAAKARDFMNDPKTLSQIAARCRAFARETFGGDDVVDGYVKVFTGEA